jgi:hypothetical protein
MRSVEARLSALLGVPLTLARVDGADDRCTGRAALKALVPVGLDPGGLTFPHRVFSLSHAGGVAVAVRGEVELAGIGVDFEPWRQRVHPRIARFFLRPAEQRARLDARTLVRLWTVKESLFKALPDNASRVLLDIELADPGAPAGPATGPRGERLRYAGVDLGPGHLAVAVHEGNAHVAVG